MTPLAVFAALLPRLESVGGQIRSAASNEDGGFLITVAHPDVNVVLRNGENTVEIRCRKGLFPPTRAHVDVDDIMTVIEGWMKEAGGKCGKTALMTPTRESEAFERAFSEENEMARETAAENADYGLGREITEAVRQRKANERAAALKGRRRKWGVDGPTPYQKHAALGHHMSRHSPDGYDIIEECDDCGARWLHHPGSKYPESMSHINMPKFSKTKPHSEPYRVVYLGHDMLAAQDRHFMTLREAQYAIAELKQNPNLMHLELNDERPGGKEWYYDRDRSGFWKRTVHN